MNTLNKKTSERIKKANYIINLYKSLNKGLNETLDSVIWYTINDDEQKFIETYIKANFN